MLPEWSTCYDHLRQATRDDVFTISTPSETRSGGDPLAIPSVTVGDPEFHGLIEDLLFPIHHGILYYPGVEVLPPFVLYARQPSTRRPLRVPRRRRPLRSRLDKSSAVSRRMPAHLCLSRRLRFSGGLRVRFDGR